MNECINNKKKRNPTYNKLLQMHVFECVALQLLMYLLHILRFFFIMYALLFFSLETSPCSDYNFPARDQ